jgi:hypothetical protein
MKVDSTFFWIFGLCLHNKDEGLNFCSGITFTPNERMVMNMIGSKEELQFYMVSGLTWHTQTHKCLWLVLSNNNI